MNILIVSQYFWPENFRINDLAIDLKRRGHNVTVLTGKPNYPQGKIYSGYSIWSHNKDFYNEIEIIRVPIIPRGNGNGFRLVINYLSFAFSGSIYLLFNRRQFDVSLTYAISPITSVYPALIHKKIYKSKVYLWVQDLWPESVSAVGKIQSGFILKLLNQMVRKIYQSSDKILIQSSAFSESVMNKGVNANKIIYVPNWAEDLFVNPININKNKYKHLIPRGFIIMFAGNIGEAQDFDSLLKAAELTKDNKNIKWIIIGDGRRKNFVENEIIRLGITETVIILGRYPIEDMPNFFIHADIMLITLRDEYIFSLTVPSKIQHYLAFGKPILSMMNGIGSSIIEESDCGFAVSAGDYINLAKKAILAYKDSNASLTLKGENGKEYYLRNFSKEKIIDNIMQVMKE